MNYSNFIVVDFDAIDQQAKQLSSCGEVGIRTDWANLRLFGILTNGLGVGSHTRRSDWTCCSAFWDRALSARQFPGRLRKAS
jgi:hypothetical protein